MRSIFTMSSMLAAVTLLATTFVLPTQAQAIYFGTATDRATKYGSLVPATFNMLVAENGMKWNAHQTSATNWDFTTSKAQVAYAKANNMKMRGHALIYHNQLPSYMCTATGGQDGAMCIATPLSATQLAAAVETRIQKVFANLNDPTITCWDVLNEAVADDGNGLKQSIFVKLMGPDYITQVFTWARKYAPAGVQLFYNDYNIENYSSPKTNKVYEIVSALKTKNLIDGIGFQMHLSMSYGQTNQTGGLDLTFQKFAALGLTIHITEMDVTIQGVAGTQASLLTQQAAWYKYVATTCRNNAKCTALVVWGVTDTDSWRASGLPLLFDGNQNKKESYTAVVNALAAAPTNSPTVTPAPTTVAPTTYAPTTSAPTTSAPTTAAPTTSAPTTRAPTTVAPTPAPTTSGATVAIYGQCGGQGYTGSTVCASPSKCVVSNQYYSQCL